MESCFQDQTKAQVLSADTQALTPYRDSGIFKGTRLLTADGDMPVEYLSDADRVITRDQGMCKIRNIRRVFGPVPCVMITAGALGEGQPTENTLLPAGQLVLIRIAPKGTRFGFLPVLLPVGQLVDYGVAEHAGIEQQNLFQITCDKPHILYVQGLEIGTADAASARAAKAAGPGGSQNR
jgi:Hint domain